jgi:hypothetical protein
VFSKHIFFGGLVDKAVELGSYNEAKNQSIWKTSKNEELKALEKNKTWTLVTLPEEKIV